MRIAIDIDSTLHHYWDTFSALAKRRFGVELAYEHQHTWSITLLRPEQVQVIVADSHREEHVLGAEPYPGAVEAVRAWHEAGHFIHITSHRDVGSHEVTERWLGSIGMPFDELYCSYDKISRCREIGIDLLIDDSPVNLARALEHGIAAATISHPWNRELLEEEAQIVAAADWPALRLALAGILERH